ncbi:MAG: tripartite tricarboxylate transporter substrate binding protein [Betaproteobacteria bacterium]
MTKHKRFLQMTRAAACAAAFFVVAACAHAQSTRNATAYPTKPVRLLVPFTPGGSQDVIARLFGQLVGDAVGQQVVIDNRAGAGGLIAATETAHANPDAYTLLLSGGAQIAIAPALNAKLAYDPVKDFIHVMHLVDLPLVLIVNPALPAANLREFVAYAKANRGKVNTASTGRGTYTHLTIELFNSITGAELTHIPYKGAAPALNDLMGRQIQAMFTTTTSAQPYTSTGRLKALGITAPKRSPTLADIPTFAEGGVANLNVSSWIGISVPAGSPAPAVRRLSDAFGQALQAPVLRERLAVLGAEPVGDTSEKFTRMVRADIDRWAKIIKSAGITID